MSIPPRFLDELRNRLTLSEVIGRRMKLTRAGREFKGCCPFHREKSPSFYVNDDKQFYHCFGCGAHGDVVGFVMQNDNISFIDAVGSLAAQAGLKVPDQSPQEIEKSKREKNLYTLMEDATRWFEEQLDKRENSGAREYLTKRGVDDQTLSSFRLGFAPADGQLLRKYLLSKEYSDAEMMEAGLLRKSDRGGEPYLFFRERIMFPVSDRRGRVIAFGARILPDHLRAPDRGDFKPPKYINSSDTPLFHKSRVLYGESHARQASADGQDVIVVEGYVDVMACSQYGFKGAVAPMGTALTEEQIVSLWKMIPGAEKNPVLCFDGDNAGRRAAARAVERLLPLLAPNQSARIAFLPDGEDPDTLLRNGGSPALQKILDQAMTLFEFVWASHTAGKDFKTPEARAGVTRDLEEEIRKIADRSVQTHYKELLRARISETFFPRKSFQGRDAKPGRSLLRPRSPVSKARSMVPRALVAALVNHPHIFETVEEMLAHLEIGEEAVDRVRQACMSALSADPTLDSEALCNHLKDIGLGAETGDILSESVYVHAAFAAPRAAPENVAQQWTAFWQGAEERGLLQEIRQGWKAAFRTGSEEDEDKLRHMMHMRKTGE